jgi:cytochrome c biogenesis protein CcmG/thiol:disulfide interchange protein DsbE
MDSAKRAADAATAAAATPATTPATTLSNASANDTAVNDAGHKGADNTSRKAITRLLWLIAFVGGLAGLFVFGITRDPNRRDNIDSVLTGRPLPAFSMPLFDRYHGNYGEVLEFTADSSTSTPTGQPMIINFWASWCGPCRDEAPVLERTHRRHGSEVLVLGVNTQDRNRDNARAFLSEYNLTFPNGIDENSRIGINYGIFGLPETFFVAADGTLLYKHAGAVTQAVIDEQLERMLPQ